MILILPIIAYLFFCVFLIYHWCSIKVFIPNSNQSFKNFSLIIAAKNEQINILNLLKSIENQDFNTVNFEVIIIDDHSDDATFQVLLTYKLTSKLNLVIVQNKDFGKKAAITLGVSMAKYDSILCTDADCELPPNWLKTYAKFFDVYNPKFVFGAVDFKSNPSIFQSILTLELSTLIGTGAATWQMKSPTMSNGANIGFTKEAFYDVLGYQNIDNQPSGDDVFLMLKMYKKYSNDVYFIKSTEAKVVTNPPINFNEFHHQRLRWASKWGNYTAAKASIIGLVVLFNYIAIIGFYFLCFTELLHYFSKNIFIFCILIKMILEYIFIFHIQKFYKKNIPIFPFLLLYLFYPFYLVYFAVASRWIKYTWKNIKY